MDKLTIFDYIMSIFVMASSILNYFILRNNKKLKFLEKDINDMIKRLDEKHEIKLQNEKRQKEYEEI